MDHAKRVLHEEMLRLIEQQRQVFVASGRGEMHWREVVAHVVELERELLEVREALSVIEEATVQPALQVVA